MNILPLVQPKGARSPLPWCFASAALGNAELSIPKFYDKKVRSRIFYSPMLAPKTCCAFEDKLMPNAFYNPLEFNERAVLSTAWRLRRHTQTTSMMNTGFSLCNSQMKQQQDLQNAMSLCTMRGTEETASNYSTFKIENGKHET
ncbi:hypothetical protein M758_8G059900 [Ceratodon purpureus]|uniref:Uncharacterized protein n=1 Tax=Ceratodon purpureus TaxID=3225 RepID=A0A8T0H0B4_CERPU|nr:hypothetical protein KC19_8G063400 [Ceratodon purpureus]KAG0607851.1 hypothetical protein M758_8G059900 [Ceratodon purpureus]